ncbi:hypothetical protein O3S80_04030 [Streptomyces sp. Lzd4kr]|nr:hypothetical protein [Streptomyces sp. Lzd4kr]
MTGRRAATAAAGPTTVDLETTMNDDPQTTETARNLLDRHGLPEDIIDSALCLHAQELASAQRAFVASRGLIYPGSIREVINSIDPAHSDAPAAGGVASAVPVAAPPTEQAALREQIAEAVREFPFDNYGLDDVAYLLDSEPDTQEWVPKLAAAVLAILPPPADRAASVCICGHTEQQHFEDACLVCDCGDYLVPEAAREVIDRWREAARKAERIRENADFHLGQEMARRQLAEKETTRLRAVVARVAQMADAWEQRLPEVIRTPAVVSALRAALAAADDPSRLAAETPQPETQARRCAHNDVVYGLCTLAALHDGDCVHEHQPKPEVVHACPPDGSGLTPCCGRTPFELPLSDRISSEVPVTCPGPAVVQADGEA